MSYSDTAGNKVVTEAARPFEGPPRRLSLEEARPYFTRRGFRSLERAVRRSGGMTFVGGPHDGMSVGSSANGGV